MRYSSLTALCAAPLALGGFLQADLAARGVIGAEPHQLPARNLANKDIIIASNSKGTGKASKANGLTQGQAGEVIIIWANAGGGQATQTVSQDSESCLHRRKSESGPNELSPLKTSLRTLY